MKSFMQWLSDKGLGENSLRTSLGIYPPNYGTGQYPPLYFAPISATASNAFATIHGGEHKELLSDPIKKQFEKNKKRKKQPQVKDK